MHEEYNTYIRITKVYLKKENKLLKHENGLNTHKLENSDVVGTQGRVAYWTVALSGSAREMTRRKSPSSHF